jgi:hypothetical protein
MDLTTNGAIVTDAMKYVQSKVDHLNNTADTDKQLLEDTEDNNDNAALNQEQTQTHNGIF